MDLTAHISYRPAYSEHKVIWMRIKRYWQTGYLLHLMALFSIILFYYFGKKSLVLLNQDGISLSLCLNAYACGYFFSLIFFSLLDARSRYQNYKLAKDRLFKYGFDARLLKPFVYSRCQRDAIRAAARDLKFNSEWEELTKKMGFRWYHILPDIIVKNPRILFTRDYWKKTLFVSTYQSKYFLW